MKNKKAMLLASEVLKIVLAVIGIIILAYLLFALYNSNQKQQKLVEAKATMERILEIINELKSNSNYVEGEVLQMTPKNWALFSFVQNDVKPNSCSGQDCLCICDKVSDFFGLIKNRQQNECSKFGTCLIVEDLKKFDVIPLSEGGDVFNSIRIKKSGKWIEVIKI